MRLSRGIVSVADTELLWTAPVTRAAVTVKALRAPMRVEKLADSVFSGSLP
jgi:hypothetical protein